MRLGLSDLLLNERVARTGVVQFHAGRVQGTESGRLYSQQAWN